MSNESIMEASQQDRPMAEGNVIIKRATLHASCLGIFVAKKHHSFNFENSKNFIGYCFLFLAPKLALRLLDYFAQNQFGYDDANYYQTFISVRINLDMMMQTTIQFPDKNIITDGLGKIHDGFFYFLRSLWQN